MSYLAIQWITTAYLDGQAGAKRASKRARLRAFPLPPSNDNGILHSVHVDVRRGVEPASTTGAATLHNGTLLLANGFRITCVERTLAFYGPSGSSLRAGFVVPDGAWGRVIWNAKDADLDGQKWVLEHIVNAGRFAAPPRRNIFRGLPTVERDLRRSVLPRVSSSSS